MLIKRIENPQPVFAMLDDMIVERGTKEDWALLSALHSRSEGVPAGVRYWRCVLHGETIGVMVTSSPKLLLRERHRVFPNIKPGNDNKVGNTFRAMWINRNIRVISRFVVDTMYRGIGVGYRFQNIASRMEGIKYLEIQSSMSKFNLFAEKAGSRFVKPSNSNKYDVGMRFFRSTFKSNPADHKGILQEIEAMPDWLKADTLNQTRAFYYRHSAFEKTGAKLGTGRGRVDTMPVDSLIRNLQQMTLGSPLYGIYVNPDHGNTLPDRIPLSAFDAQGVDEPLKWGS